MKPLAGQHDEDDETLEDESRVKGSPDASLTIQWPKIKDKMNCRTNSQLVVGSVELRGVHWSVNAKNQANGDKVGFYLTHRSGSKDQIAFSITISDVSSGSEHILAEDRFGGNWVLFPAGLFFPGFAADGKGECVDVMDLQNVDLLRIGFHAHGPATKHHNAI